jgi:hypothetical protein
MTKDEWANFLLGVVWGVVACVIALSIYATVIYPIHPQP